MCGQTSVHQQWRRAQATPTCGANRQAPSAPATWLSSAEPSSTGDTCSCAITTGSSAAAGGGGVDDVLEAAGGTAAEVVSMAPGVTCNGGRSDVFSGALTLQVSVQSVCC